MTTISDVDGKLLHMIVRSIPKGRINLCDNDQFLQCASLRLEKGTTFRPHQHNWNHFEGLKIAQEAWIIIKGSVLVTYFDTKGNNIFSDIITAGEASFTFEGGHNYEILEDDTIVYEFKSGPYIGQQHDKSFI